MGLFDRFHRPTDAQARGLVVRSEGSGDDPDPIDVLLADIIEQRRSGFGLTDALALAPIVRGIDLITSVAASFLPIAYRRGGPVPDQPRIVRRPDPSVTRAEFVSQTVWGLIVYGCAYWRLGDPDPYTGKPRIAQVLPHDEVAVTWDERRAYPLYRWRGVSLRRGVDIKHITIGRRPGELHGRGPVETGLANLYPVYEAEEFAANFFTSGGIPMTVIKAASQLAKGEAKKLKAQWMESRKGAEPAVLDNVLNVDFPGVDPQRSQLQEARAYGATIGARLLGIPAPLLHVETSGATVVYQNAGSAVEELVKATVAPRYLVPIEQAWSDLAPDPQAVRFDLAELSRADIKARADTYAVLIEAGVLRPEEARAFEGWSNDQTEAVNQFEPSVTAPEPQEVPVG